MKRNQYQREWAKKNREKVRARDREYWANLSPEKKQEIIDRHRDWRHKVKNEAIQIYGGVCACCGEKEVKFLCIDHIDGGGNQHRKTIKTRSIGEWLKTNNYPKGFQVLCHNCNMAKSIYGKCPHN